MDYYWASASVAQQGRRFECRVIMKERTPELENLVPHCVFVKRIRCRNRVGDIELFAVGYFLWWPLYPCHLQTCENKCIQTVCTLSYALFVPDLTTTVYHVVIVWIIDRPTVVLCVVQVVPAFDSLPDNSSCVFKLESKISSFHRKQTIVECSITSVSLFPTRSNLAMQ